MKCTILQLTYLLTISNVLVSFKMVKQRVPHQSIQMAADHDILVRTLRGEDVERTPVWLMRQVLLKGNESEYDSLVLKSTGGKVYGRLQEIF